MSFFNKNNAFLYLTKAQKAALLSHLKRFTKKHSAFGVQKILDEFLEEENYYYEVGNPHFEWIFEYFEKDSFLDEIKKYISVLLFELEQKERQKPFLEEQKKRAKQMRKQAQEFKMSKEAPTKKQLYYYEKLCKRYNIAQKETEELSRLDLRNMIDEILSSYNDEKSKIS